MSLARATDARQVVFLCNNQIPTERSSVEPSETWSREVWNLIFSSLHSFAMRTTRLERRKFVKALRRNDTAAVRTYLRRRPALAFRTVHELCNGVALETFNIVAEYVLTHSSQKGANWFVSCVIDSERVDLFVQIFRLADRVGKSSEKIREMREWFTDLVADSAILCECLRRAVVTACVELADLLLKFADELMILSVMEYACETGNEPALQFLLDRGMSPDEAMHYLISMYYETRPDTVVESSTVLMRRGCTMWHEWLHFVYGASKKVQTSSAIVQTAFGIVETCNIRYAAFAPCLVRSLLEAGASRERLAETRFGIPQAILDELDAARYETREQCTMHLPRVLGDIVANYLP